MVDGHPGIAIKVIECVVTEFGLLDHRFRRVIGNVLPICWGKSWGNVLLDKLAAGAAIEFLENAKVQRFSEHLEP